MLGSVVPYIDNLGLMRHNSHIVADGVYPRVYKLEVDKWLKRRMILANLLLGYTH